MANAASGISFVVVVVVVVVDCEAAYREWYNYNTVEPPIHDTLSEIMFMYDIADLRYSCPVVLVNNYSSVID